MLKKLRNSGFIKSVTIGFIFGAVSFFVLLILFSLIVNAVAASEEKAIVFATVLITASAFVSGAVSSYCAEKRKLAVGITAGTMLYLISAVISAAVGGEGFSSLFLLRIFLCALASALGTVLITFVKPSRKII